LSQPRALAIDEQNELIYIEDYMRQTILIYNLEGDYQFEVGGRGTDPGWFNFPTAMIMNKHQQFVVADLFNRRVQVLELGYEEWKNRYELAPAGESAQGDGPGAATESAGHADTTADETGKPEKIGGSQLAGGQETQEGALGIIIQKHETPDDASGQGAVNEQSPDQGGDVSGGDTATTLDQQGEQPHQEKVMEVVLPKEPVSTFPEPDQK
jgi:hypothetical protein